MDSVNGVKKKETKETKGLNKLNREQNRISRLGPELRGRLFVIQMARRADRATLFCGKEKFKTRLSSEHFVYKNTQVALKNLN